MIDNFTITDVMICTTYRIRNFNKLRITLNSYEFLDLRILYLNQKTKKGYIIRSHSRNYVQQICMVRNIALGFLDFNYSYGNLIETCE